MENVHDLAVQHRQVTMTIHYEDIIDFVNKVLMSLCVWSWENRPQKLFKSLSQGVMIGLRDRRSELTIALDNCFGLGCLVWIPSEKCNSNNFYYHEVLRRFLKDLWRTKPELVHIFPWFGPWFFYFPSSSFFSSGEDLWQLKRQNKNRWRNWKEFWNTRLLNASCNGRLLNN